MSKDAIFHQLWTRDVGTPGYDKSKWKELETLLWKGIRAEEQIERLVDQHTTEANQDYQQASAQIQELANENEELKEAKKQTKGVSLQEQELVTEQVGKLLSRAMEAESENEQLKKEVADLKSWKGTTRGAEYRDNLLSKPKEDLVSMIIASSATYIQQEYDKAQLKADIEAKKADIAQKCTGDIRPVPTSNQIFNHRLKAENELKI